MHKRKTYDNTLVQCNKDLLPKEFIQEYDKPVDKYPITKLYSDLVLIYCVILYKPEQICSFTYILHLAFVLGKINAALKIKKYVNHPVAAKLNTPSGKLILLKMESKLFIHFNII